LDETVYGIAERTDSGVATIYRTEERETLAQGTVPISAGHSNENPLENVEAGPAAGSFADLYPDYPIRVQVLRGQPQPAVAAATAKPITFDPRVRFLLKTAVAAAAMIPLALVFLNTPTASGTTLAQVFKAFAEAQNVHITRFYPNTGQVNQELWISREADVVLTVEGHTHTMYDLARRKKYSNQTPGPFANSADLSERELAGARLLMNNCLGLPSKEILRDAHWTHASNDGVKGIETYELAYTEQSQSETALLWMWKIHIDPVRKLPAEIQGFRKAPFEDQWHCLRRTEFQYLMPNEMASVLKREHVPNGGSSH